MEGSALKGNQPLVHELLPAVDDLGGLCPVLESPGRHIGDVLLVHLTEVGRERIRNPTLLADPGHGNRRVETTREGDPDPLADGE